VWYLYSQQAATEIRAFNPATRIIIMLRNPIDMMYSLHSQRVYNDNENIADFAEALAAEADRRQGKRLYHKASDAMGSLYRAAATYTPQVQRYFTTFGRERVLVIIFDDFVRTTSEVYRQTCEFLEVDSQFRPEFRIVNANKGIYSPALRSFLRYPPKPVRWLLPLLGLPPAGIQGVVTTAQRQARVTAIDGP
jgi:Sulfotransferase domain